jgi:hypothetical protein
MSASLIVVFDATREQGGALASAILGDPRRRFAVRAVTREPGSDAARALAGAGADVVCAATDTVESLRYLMRGVHGVFRAGGLGERPSPRNELALADAMAQAASRERVAHVVWSTLEDTRRYALPGNAGAAVLNGEYNVARFDGDREASYAFTARRVPTTLLYPALDWESLVGIGLRPAHADRAHALVVPTGAARLPGIAASDVGACAFAIFARGDELIGKSIGIAGEHLTAAQIAEQLALAIGERVTHSAISPDDYRALDFPAADELGNMFRFMRDFEGPHCDTHSVSCSRELNADLQTFAGWLARNAHRLPGRLSNMPAQRTVSCIA